MEMMKYHVASNGEGLACLGHEGVMGEGGP